MMPVLYRASIGYLLRHPWQLALTLLGICIGVAVIVAVDLANESSRKAFLLSMDTVTGEATHQIIGGPNGVDEQLYTRLRVETGVRSIAPVVDEEPRLVLARERRDLPAQGEPFPGRHILFPELEKAHPALESAPEGAEKIPRRRGTPVRDEIKGFEDALQARLPGGQEPTTPSRGLDAVA